MESAAATHRRRWSQAEKDMCAAGVKKYGAFNHRRIASLIGTRSKAQVRTYLYAAGYRKLGAAPFYTTVDQPPATNHVPFWSAAELAADGWAPPQPEPLPMAPRHAGKTAHPALWALLLPGDFGGPAGGAHSQRRAPLR